MKYELGLSEADAIEVFEGLLNPGLCPYVVDEAAVRRPHVFKQILPLVSHDLGMTSRYVRFRIVWGDVDIRIDLVGQTPSSHGGDLAIQGEVFCSVCKLEDSRGHRW